MIKRHKRAGLIARASSFVLAMAMFTQAAQGQDTPATAPSADTAPSEGEAAAITVVGSQIKGAKLNAALPVTVVDQQLIAASGAVNGQDLFRSIPQMGDVTFNAQYTAGSSNSARGDVNSINLRNLGVGNTLVLLNGRRVVTHPTSQANDQLVPVLGYNSNAIPVNGLERLEVLRDGAAAIYGADAVAGVVNTVLKTNFNGADMSVQYGGAEGTRLREFNASGLFGKNFAEGAATSRSTPPMTMARAFSRPIRPIQPVRTRRRCLRARLLPPPPRSTGAAPRRLGSRPRRPPASARSGRAPPR
jgi:outer membrane receptor protein involved in Fe transport